MSLMFYRSQFNGDISQWNVSKVKYMYDMFKGSPLEKNIITEQRRTEFSNYMRDKLIRKL